MLTLPEFNKIPLGTIFATGEIENSPDPKGLYFVDSHIGRMLKWLAKKGDGDNSWAIYVHWATTPLGIIKTSGDKVQNNANIQKLVPCDNEVLNLYRR